MGSKLNLARVKAYRPNWDWEGFRGSGECLHWNSRDLHHLDFAISLTRHRRTAVQAGGNLGLFPKRLAEDFNLVYTFEPDPTLFGHLKHNAPEKNIFPVMAAVGNSNDPISVSTGRRDNSGRDVHEGITYVAGDGDIPQVRIDELKLQACDLLYLDIEGYELEALRGAEDTVRRCRPVIGVELNGNVHHYGHTKDDVRNWFSELAYVKVTRMHGDDIYVPAEYRACE